MPETPDLPGPTPSRADAPCRGAERTARGRCAATLAR